MTVCMSELRFQGISLCRGVAIGKPVCYIQPEESVPSIHLSVEAIEDEILRYRRAIDKSRLELQSIHNNLESEKLHEGATILNAHLQMLEDPLLTSHIEHAIQSTRKNAETVLQTHLRQYEDKFQAIDDPFFQERFKDIRDIASRIMSCLISKTRLSLNKLPPDTILFAKELSAAETAEASNTNIIALVTQQDGLASHAAIVAKAKGTPYVSNVAFDQINFDEHSLAIVDGRTGEVILSPSLETLRKYQYIRSQLREHLDRLCETSLRYSITENNSSVRLSANIEKSTEIDAVHLHGGNGVGLYRSEFICLAQGCFPAEEEQYTIYRELVQKMQGLPIVIRTFDIGGDKLFPMLHNHLTDSFLGCRAIRFFLQEKEIFKSQLKAILRASYYGDVSIMFPMISTLSELLEAKQLLEESRQELEEKGYPCGSLRIGCMIEVPSAAIIADLLAKECDFLSIGTNDLIQYVLGVDRSNHAMNALYTPSHPSIVRLIKMVVKEANQAKIPVTVCGEVAADPRFTALLVGLGVHELSVSTRYLATIKRVLSLTSQEMADEIANKALSLTTAEEIQQLLTEEYKKIAPDDCFYNY